MKTIIEALQGAGYTSRHVPEHWDENWRERRWFGFQGPDSSIVEVVTANHYLRITQALDGQFEVREYRSAAYPERPKTDFFIDPFREPKILEIRQLMVAIDALTTIRQQKAA